MVSAGLGDNGRNFRECTVEDDWLGIPYNSFRVFKTLHAALDTPEVSYRLKEAASYLLDMESPKEGWSAEDYRTALKSQFGL